MNLLFSEALKMLARKEYSAHLLKEKLLQHLSQPNLDEVENVLEELRSVGYLNDERYAQTTAQRYYERYYGPTYIHQHLQQAGISDHLISTVLESLDFEASLKQLCLKRSRTSPPLSFGAIFQTIFFFTTPWL